MDYIITCETVNPRPYRSNVPYTKTQQIFLHNGIVVYKNKEVRYLSKQHTIIIPRNSSVGTYINRVTHKKYKITISNIDIYIEKCILAKNKKLPIEIQKPPIKKTVANYKPSDLYFYN